VFIYICSLEWFIFSKSIEFMYLRNCFTYLLVSSFLLTGQFSTLGTLFFKVSLSFFSMLHWNIRWSTVCMSCLHGHSGLPIIFNRCEYDRIYPWPFIIVVTFGRKFKFTVSLLFTLGKNSLVITPFVDYTLITNLMHWLLFSHKILFSSTCFEHQVLIFRRTQLYTSSIWYRHSL